MKKMMVLFLTCSVVFVLVVNVHPASGASDTGAIDRLIATYGKDPIISFILKNCGRKITLSVNGELTTFTGSPDSKYVTSRTILSDLQGAGITVKQLEETLLSQKREAENVERERIRQKQEKELAEKQYQEWLLTDEGKKLTEEKKKKEEREAEQRRILAEKEREKRERESLELGRLISMERQADSQCQNECRVNPYQYDKSCHRACMSAHGF